MNNKPDDRKISPPKPYEIALYWRRREPRFVDDLFAPRCFACQFFPFGEHKLKNPKKGWGGRLQRCHIIAHSIGGSFAPSNFMMLCQRCHHEAPMTSDPRVMIRWAKRHRSYIGTIFDEYRQAIEETKLLDVYHLWRASDRHELPEYFRARKLDFHPHSSRLERCKLMMLLARQYLEERQFEQGSLFGDPR